MDESPEKDDSVESCTQTDDITSSPSIAFGTQTEDYEVESASVQTINDEAEVSTSTDKPASEDASVSATVDESKPSTSFDRSKATTEDSKDTSGQSKGTDDSKSTSEESKDTTEKPKDTSPDKKSERKIAHAIRTIKIPKDTSGEVKFTGELKLSPDEIKFTTDKTKDTGDETKGGIFFFSPVENVEKVEKVEAKKKEFPKIFDLPVGDGKPFDFETFEFDPKAYEIIDESGPSTSDGRAKARSTTGDVRFADEGSARTRGSLAEHYRRIRSRSVSRSRRSRTDSDSLEEEESPRNLQEIIAELEDLAHSNRNRRLAHQDGPYALADVEPMFFEQINEIRNLARLFDENQRAHEAHVELVDLNMLPAQYPFGARSGAGDFRRLHEEEGPPPPPPRAHQVGQGDEIDEVPPPIPFEADIEDVEEEAVVQEDVVQEDAVQENAVQEDVVQEDAVQEDVVQEDVVQEEIVQVADEQSPESSLINETSSSRVSSDHVFDLYDIYETTEEEDEEEIEEEVVEKAIDDKSQGDHKGAQGEVEESDKNDGQGGGDQSVSMKVVRDDGKIDRDAQTDKGKFDVAIQTGDGVKEVGVITDEESPKVEVVEVVEEPPLFDAQLFAQYLGGQQMEGRVGDDQQVDQFDDIPLDDDDDPVLLLADLRREMRAMRIQQQLISCKTALLEQMSRDYGTGGEGGMMFHKPKRLKGKSLLKWKYEPSAYTLTELINEDEKRKEEERALYAPSTSGIKPPTKPKEKTPDDSSDFSD